MILPVTHRILVKPVQIQEKDETFKRAKQSGIIIPEESKEMKREQQGVDEGTVLAFGPTVFQDFGTENPLKVGDTILYARHAGKAVKDPDDGEDYLVLNDEDVVCILKKGISE